MKKISSILISLSLLLNSCSFLEVEPQGIYRTEEYYNNVSELQTALRGVYSTMGVSALYGQMYSGRMAQWGDLGFSNYSVDRGTVAENAVTTSDAKIKGYWQALYAGINNANLLIANIDKAKDVDEKEKAGILAQARFLRAYYYFMLTVKFVNVPLRTVPVTGSTVSELQLAQTPSPKVYEFIISEMEAAAKDVEPISNVISPGVVSQSAVWGILARVCLYNAGYPNFTPGMYAKAREYAAKVIDSGLHSLNPDYKQVFINYMQDLYDAKESIFEVEFYGNNKSAYNSTAGQIGRCIGPRNKNIDAKLGYCLGTVRSNQYHWNLYDETDLRRDWNIVSYYYDASDESNVISLTNTFGKFAGKFRREYEILLPRANDATPTNFPLLRYSDVLLMFAEAYAADIEAPASDEDRAYECFNMVRRRGHGLDQNVPSDEVDYAKVSDRTEFVYEIQNERARELAYEMLRKDDLVRWGIFYDRMHSSEMNVPTTLSESNYQYASRYVENVDRKDVRWPIPATEMSVNSLLVQNEGW